MQALDFLAEISDGDARRALAALEVGVLSATRQPVEFTLEVAQDSIQRKALDYDATGDAHYDVASAFIKSMRGSDPDAAIYWLARMLEAGEDPRFIARRDRHLRFRGRWQRRSAGPGHSRRGVASS